MNNQLDADRLVRRLSSLLGVDLPITAGIALGRDSEHRPQVGETEMRNPFVIRHLTGDLLLLFGLALTITGSVGGASVRAKPAGISIDLWTGLAMPLVSLMMIAWVSWRPPSALSRQRRIATATDAPTTAPTWLRRPRGRRGSAALIGRGHRAGWARLENDREPLAGRRGGNPTSKRIDTGARLHHRGGLNHRADGRVTFFLARPALVRWTPAVVGVTVAR
jgi:hypothetical protein